LFQTRFRHDSRARTRAGDPLARRRGPAARASGWRCLARHTTTTNLAQLDRCPGGPSLDGTRGGPGFTPGPERLGGLGGPGSPPCRSSSRQAGNEFPACL
jgi:hypothetical protein